MYKKWKRELEDKIKSDEKTKGDILSRLKCETFDYNMHNMLVDEDLSAAYQNLLDLEYADLFDFQKRNL